MLAFVVGTDNRRYPTWRIHLSHRSSACGVELATVRRPGGRPTMPGPDRVIAGVAVAGGGVPARGRHGEYAAEYSRSDVLEVPHNVCKLLSFGLAELSDHQHAVRMRSQNRGIRYSQQRRRIQDHIVVAGAKFIHDLLRQP